MHFELPEWSLWGPQSGHSGGLGMPPPRVATLDPRIAILGNQKDPALDPRVTTRQVIGLRFAPDEELVSLAQRAAEENLSEDEIKKAVKNWRVDDYRV